MEHSPSWEVNSHSASQEIPHLLWNSNVYYRFHKSLPLVPILNHLNPDHSFTHFLFNIVLPFKNLSSLQFSQLKFCMHFSILHAFYMPRPSHPSFDYPYNI